MKRLFLIILALAVSAGATGRPTGSALYFLRDSFGMGVLEFGHLFDTLPDYYVSRRTNTNDGSALEIQSKIDSMITDATGTAATWRYIICNTGLHDAIFNGPDTTYPMVVTLAQETTAWNYIINALTTAFPNAELIWQNTSPVNETIADRDGMTWKNTTIKMYSDSMYNLFKNHGFKKRIPVDSFITAAGLQPDTADGIHYTNGTCYQQIASFMAKRIRKFTSCSVIGWDGSNCLYYASSSLFPYRPLPDSTKWPTWSPFYNVGSNIALMHHASGSPYYLLSPDVVDNTKLYYTVQNGYKIIRVGDATGLTIELAANIYGSASGYIFSVMGVYDNANNYLSVFYVSNTLYVRMHIGGIQVLESETGGLTDGNHVITIQENNGSPWQAWYVYYDGVYQSVFAASTFTPYTFTNYPKYGENGLAGSYSGISFQGVRIYSQFISTARITAGATNIYTLAGQSVKTDTAAGTFHFTPSLISPANTTSSTISKTNISFNWGKVAYDSCYILEIDTSSLFTSALHTLDTITDTTKTKTFTRDTTIYYWRVKSGYIGNIGQPSAAYSLKTASSGGNGGLVVGIIIGVGTFLGSIGIGSLARKRKL